MNIKKWLVIPALLLQGYNALQAEKVEFLKEVKKHFDDVPLPRRGLGNDMLQAEIVACLKNFKTRYLLNQAIKTPASFTPPTSLNSYWRTMRPLPDKYGFSADWYGITYPCGIFEDSDFDNEFKEYRKGGFTGIHRNDYTIKTRYKKQLAQNREKQLHLFHQLKKIFIGDLMGINQDVLFWHRVLTKTVPNAPKNYTETWHYLKQFLQENDLPKIITLLDTAILEATNSYKNTPYWTIQRTQPLESAKLMTLFNEYLESDKPQPLSLKQLQVIQTDGRLYSQWTHGTYFWRMVLQDMGYDINQSDITKTLESILKTNDRATIINLLNTALRKVAFLEGTSPKAWWEYLKRTVLDRPLAPAQ